jgi:uncharacterized Ntn-hydrolase superfamily protein
MAARTNRPTHNEDTRKKIQSSQLINFLQGHVFNGSEVKKTQITAAIALLRKTLPDLQSIEGGMDVTIRSHEDALRELEAASKIEPAEQVNGEPH